MQLCRSVAALLSFFLFSLESADAFAPKKTQFPSTRLSVANDVTETQEQDIPYALSRGDGSTGGGGLPMPQQQDDGLVRPKVSPTRCRLVLRVDVHSHKLLRHVAQVGAEMPKGRPSWFRVPGPSQGSHLCLILYAHLSYRTV